jgi:hypothetical protein
MPPELAQVPPYGAVALRAAWRLAVPLCSVGLVTSVVPSGVSGGEMFVRSGPVTGCGGRRIVCYLRACGEGFEGIGDDGGAEEGAEFFGIGDGVEGIAEAVGDGAEAEIEGFEDGLAAGGKGAFAFAVGEAFLDSILAAFHSAFLVKFLGEGHGCGAVGFGTD